MTEPASRARRLAAFLLSFALPGGGHIVLGRWRRGAVLVACFAMAIVSVPWTRTAGLAAALALYLATAVDAVLAGARPRPAWSSLIAGGARRSAGMSSPSGRR